LSSTIYTHKILNSGVLHSVNNSHNIILVVDCIVVKVLVVVCSVVYSKRVLVVKSLFTLKELCPHSVSAVC